jgi:hypothetical protein
LEGQIVVLARLVLMVHAFEAATCVAEGSFKARSIRLIVDSIR